MKTPSAKRRLGAAVAVLLTSAVLTACGDDDVVERPAHRPISVIFVAGELEGPWKARTEGLADGVKIAIAERDGLIGERAVSTVVVPIEQRDGTTVSAAIGGGRILRDSRAIAVLGTYSAPQFALSGPQLNGGELSILQFGSGFRGLTEAEKPGEPDRFRPSGPGYVLRGVVSDSAVAERVKALSQFRGAQVIPVTDAYATKLTADAKQRAKEAQQRLEKAKEDGDDPLPSTDPKLTNPSPEVADAERLGQTIASAIGGSLIPGAAATLGHARYAGSKSAGPSVVVVDPTEPDPAAAVRRAVGGVRGPVLVIDGADREIPASALSGRRGEPALLLRRTIADATTEQARTVRAKERELFDRDRGDAVVAGYRAAKRILDLAANQPERTIDRVAYAKALTGAAPQDPNLPANAAGDATLGKVELYDLRGGRWVER